MERIKNNVDHLKDLVKTLNAEIDRLDRTLAIVAREKGEVLSRNPSLNILNRLPKAEFKKC